MTTATSRPYTILSCAMSVDGYIDDTGSERLLLSSAADFDRVDEVRAGCDAILVGAGTLRTDDPRLVLRSPERRRRRLAEGATGDPAKVTLTTSGDLPSSARFFTTGESDKVVYTASGAHAGTAARFADRHDVTVVDAGTPLDLRTVTADLAGRGVRRLLVEGGGAVHTAFLSAALVDELHLVVAPFFVGEADAARFVQPGRFPHTAATPMRLAEARPIGDLVLLRYLLAGESHG